MELFQSLSPVYTVPEDKGNYINQYFNEGAVSFRKNKVSHSRSFISLKWLKIIQLEPTKESSGVCLTILL